MVLQIVLTVLSLTMIYGKSLNDSNSLVRDLLFDYEKRSIPVKNQENALNVTAWMLLMSIKDFDEVQESFSYVATLIFEWQDEGLKWNASKYGGIDKVFLSWKDVWTPPIILSNPTNDMISFGKDWQNIRYNRTGNAVWATGALLETSCPVNALNFPFDIQTCTTIFNVLGVRKSEVRIQEYKDEVDLSPYHGHGEWTLLRTSVNTLEQLEHTSVEFTFYLKRKPQFVVINIILPISFLSLLNILVFAMVPDSGERVSFCITVLLSIAVFMTIVSDTLPKSSEPVPIISYKLMVDLILSSLITVTTIVNQTIYNKLETDSKPSWILWFIFKRKCFKRNTIQSTETDNSVFDTETTQGQNNKTPSDSEVINNQHSETCLKNITWKDISQRIDKISLILYTFAFIGNLGTFLILTSTA